MIAGRIARHWLESGRVHQGLAAPERSKLLARYSVLFFGNIDGSLLKSLHGCRVFIGNRGFKFRIFGFDVLLKALLLYLLPRCLSLLARVMKILHSLEVRHNLLRALGINLA